MDRVNLDKTIKKVHFIGIGGVSMSGLAQIMHNQNFIVSGSDTTESQLVLHLRTLGIKVFNNHAYENITNDIDIVVYTAAVKDTNPEIVSSKDKNIRLVNRAEFLGSIMESFTHAICISGTHGKTTTTSMISQALIDLKVNPTISVGATLQSIGGNFRMGSNDYFVVESCEYHDSFLNFFPYIGIILNIEEDHTDYFKNIGEIEDSFNKFANNINSSGYLIINKNIPNFNKIINNVKCTIITFGTEDSDFYISDLTYLENNKTRFNLLYKGKILRDVTLNLPGIHNIQNAIATFATVYALNLSLDIAKLSLEKFYGPDRRFQIKGKFNGVTVIDDYAHHPTEISKTLGAIKNLGYDNVVCVFQPHTYSRTKALLEDFATAFNDANTVVLLDIYSAREVDTGEIHSRDLAQKLLANNKEVFYFESFVEAENFLYKKCINNELLITMGAGDVYLIGEHLLST